MKDPRRARLVLAILVLLSITLIVFDLRGGSGGPTAPMRQAGAAVFGPVERAMASVVSPVRSLADSLATFGEKDQIIADLRAENDRLAAEVATSAVDRARADALDELLGLTGEAGFTTMPAQVIAVGPAQGFAWTVTIDAGTLDGVETDMAVVTGRGLVGRVVSVGPDTATVLLIVDATSAVGGRLTGTSQIGIVSGTGRQDVLSMQLLDPLAPIEIGDAIVSFGSQGGRPFPAGVPIGVVEEIRGSPGQLTRVAIIRPDVDVSTLDLVGVVLVSPRVEGRDPLAPGTPTVSPSPTPTSTSSEGLDSPTGEATDGTGTDGTGD